jgi:hypothetical protein
VLRNHALQVVLAGEPEQILAVLLDVIAIEEV